MSTLPNYTSKPRVVVSDTTAQLYDGNFDVNTIHFESSALVFQAGRNGSLLDRIRIQSNDATVSLSSWNQYAIAFFVDDGTTKGLLKIIQPDIVQPGMMTDTLLNSHYAGFNYSYEVNIMLGTFAKVYAVSWKMDVPFVFIAEGGDF